MLRPMPDEADPPRKVYGLKPKAFERVNTAEPGSPPPAANDVFALQRELREREIATGFDALRPTERPRSRRRPRDYWLLLLAGNGALLGLVALLGANAMTVGFAGAGLVLYTLGLTWVMWCVMGDY